MSELLASFWRLYVRKKLLAISAYLLPRALFMLLIHLRHLMLGALIPQGFISGNLTFQPVGHTNAQECTVVTSLMPSSFLTVIRGLT